VVAVLVHAARVPLGEVGGPRVAVEGGDVELGDRDGAGPPGEAPQDVGAVGRRERVEGEGRLGQVPAGARGEAGQEPCDVGAVGGDPCRPAGERRARPGEEVRRGIDQIDVRDGPADDGGGDAAVAASDVEDRAGRPPGVDGGEPAIVRR
jgi:hypothetical protein